MELERKMQLNEQTLIPHCSLLCKRQTQKEEKTNAAQKAKTGYWLKWYTAQDSLFNKM